ncbi:MAG TPA: hypothetical protein VF747_02855 [Blastocatellia bacterium]|jgi:hypothetical protein
MSQSQPPNLNDPATFQALISLLALHREGLQRVGERFDDAERHVTLGSLDREFQRLRQDCDGVETMLKNGNGLLVRFERLENRVSNLEEHNRLRNSQTEKSSTRKWDIVLLLLGFLLSSVLGAAITQWLSHLPK